MSSFVYALEGIYLNLLIKSLKEKKQYILTNEESASATDFGIKRGILPLLFELPHGRQDAHISLRCILSLQVLRSLPRVFFHTALNYSFQ